MRLPAPVRPIRPRTRRADRRARRNEQRSRRARRSAATPPARPVPRPTSPGRPVPRPPVSTRETDAPGDRSGAGAQSRWGPGSRSAPTSTRRSPERSPTRAGIRRTRRLRAAGPAETEQVGPTDDDPSRRRHAGRRATRRPTTPFADDGPRRDTPPAEPADHMPAGDVRDGARGPGGRRVRPAGGGRGTARGDQRPGGGRSWSRGLERRGRGDRRAAALPRTRTAGRWPPSR